MTTKGRKRRLFWIFAIVLVAAVLLGVHLSLYRPAPGPIRITISKETTHILGPVNEDGTVNYVAYLNAKHSKGVTKENNAAIPLINIFGPYHMPSLDGPKICEILKMEPPSEGEEYFTDLRSHINKTLNDKDADAWRKGDALAKATTKPWKARQYPVIAGWLKVNNGPMNATLVAVRRTDYYMPLVSGMMGLANPMVLAYQDMGNALVARAMLELDSGDIRSAWADLTAARRLARRIGGGYSLVNALIALTIEARACTACRELAGSGKLTGAQARTFLADMQHLSPLSDLAATIDEGERFMMLDCVMMLARATYRGGLDGLSDALEGMSESGEQQAESPTTESRGGSLEWDKILLKMNPWYDSLLTASRRKTFKTRTKALADHDRRFDEFRAEINKSRSFLQFIARYFKDPTEEIGNILISLLMPSISRAFVLRDRATTEGDLSVVAMALAVYRAEKKAYPDKLSQLSPEYLKKVPDDLFVDKPFGYKRTDKGYLLYSVGENMKFDGEKEEDEKSDDIVVRVE